MTAWPVRITLRAFWFALLFAPFGGLKNSAILFTALLVFFAAWKFLSGNSGKLLTSGPALVTEKGRKFLPFLALPVAAALPMFSQNYMIDIAILTAIYIILAEGLNVVVGFAGLLNLGFVAFYAIGAYMYALLSMHFGITFWAALPVSLLASAAAGVLLAIPALRLAGDYLAIVTLGFGEIVRLVLNNWDSVTQGPNGILGIPRPSLFGISLGRLTPFYYFVLAAAILSVVVIRSVYRSRAGRAWVAVREDEIAASSLGINVIGYKLYAMGFGAFWAGLAGALFAAKMQFVSPESFTFMESVIVLCMVILGGIGSITGVVAGAVILVLLPEFLREVQLYRMLALGGGLVALMIFRPQGLFGGKSASAGD